MGAQSVQSVMLIGTDKGSILCVCWGTSIKGHLGISDTQATKIQYMVPWEWGHTAYFNYFSLEIGIMLLASSNHHLSPIYVTLWQGICMINKLCCNKWKKEWTKAWIFGLKLVEKNIYYCKNYRKSSGSYCTGCHNYKMERKHFSVSMK